MKLTILFGLSCFLTLTSFGQKIEERLYQSFAERCIIKQTGKKDCYNPYSTYCCKEYNWTTVKLIGDSVYIIQRPSSIVGNDTLKVHPRGNLTYVGNIYQKDGVSKIYIKMTSCGFCDKVAKKYSRDLLFPTNKEYDFKYVADGLMINNQLYKFYSDK
jgi:hypothetical protein